MRFKEGVIPLKCWQFEFVCYVVDYTYAKQFGHGAMMTSALDGKHMEGSLHYDGLAWDFRIWRNNNPAEGLPPLKELLALRVELQENLGRMYDVLLKKTHIHIEFDPD